MAITKRHVIFSEHGGGSGASPRYLIWIDAAIGGQWTFDVTAVECAGHCFSIALNVPPSLSTPQDPHAVHKFRLTYMKQDIPDQLVVKLINPSDYWNSGNWGAGKALAGLPVVIFNRHNQGIVQTIDTDPATTDSGTGSSTAWVRTDMRQFGLPSDVVANRTKLWRPLLTGDSCSPVFLLHSSGVPVYLSNTTTGQNVSNWGVSGEGPCYLTRYYVGPGYISHHDRILEACVLLNNAFASQYGGNPNLMPTYI